jgi:hypothetical protein
VTALDGPVLNPEPVRRTEGVERLGAELLDAARGLPDPAAAALLAKYSGALHTVDPIALAGEDTRLAFWINVYNALVRHVVWKEGARGSVIFQLGMFRRAAYAIGGRRYSLDVIEHGLLRANRRLPLSFSRALAAGDPRLEAAPRTSDPRIHFALNCGARSCPPIRVYLSGAIHKQLDLAAGAYFASEASLDREARRVVLPRLMKYYAADFGARDDALRFAAEYLEAADGAWLRENARRVSIRYSPYDWTIGNR